MKRIRSAIILWLMSTALYKWALKHVIPYIRFSTYYPTLKGFKYHEGYDVLKTGHIILAQDRKKLTGLLIPGLMDHAALCVGRRDLGDLFEVAEMTHEDYRKSFFFDVAKEADRIVIMECRDWSKSRCETIALSAIGLQNAKYDSDFTLGIEALYCSELVLQADRIAARDAGGEPLLQVDLSDLAGLGRPYLSPDGLLFSKNCVCVWDSDNKFTGMTGEQIERGVTHG